MANPASMFQVRSSLFAIPHKVATMGITKVLVLATTGLVYLIIQLNKIILTALPSMASMHK